MGRGWGVRSVAILAILCGALIATGWVFESSSLVSGSVRPEPRRNVPVEVKGITVRAPAAPAPEPAAEPGPTVPEPAAAPEPQPEPAAALEPPPEPEPSPPPPACPDPSGTSVVDGLLAGHRNIRCAYGLPDVGIDPEMNAHAQFHAERLMQSGACATLYHSPELSSWYSQGYWGENAACMDWSRGCWSDSGRVMDGWMASPEHRPNILDPVYHWVGIGYACDGRHAYFVVQFRS